MLPKNIFNINKIISFLSIILLLSSMFVTFMQKEAEASYDSKFKNYPGYEELIKQLQEAHPNWEFEILETGLNWTDVITAESTGNHARNVVPKNKESAWRCYCNRIIESNWACASSSAVSYYMDPRNSLNEEYIFQFEQLTFDPEIQTIEGVTQIFKDCNYMQGKIKYYDSNKKEQTIDKTYIEVIMEAAKDYNISPYHLASRIRQEQGSNNGSVMITGTYAGYEGLYNYYNIGSFGSNVIANGLQTARKNGWTDPEKAIKGGALEIAKNYISIGQDTLYLQKFNVVYKNNLYSHQYMTNVSATMTEATKVREAYRKIGMLSETNRIKFKIPVYKNMPEQKCSIPGNEQIVTQDVQINQDTVVVRSGKGNTYSEVGKLNKGDKVLRIELGNSKDAEGKYWDKIVLTDGKKGYVSREYLDYLSMQNDTNESYIVTAATYFRNGPGTDGTVVIRTLAVDQIVTVVEKDKYKSVNREDWYRVKLSDGTYGYVGTGFIAPVNAEKVKVVCDDGLNIRQTASTSASVIRPVAKGTILTRIEKEVQSSDTNYIWDKITSSSGIVGYVARQEVSTKKNFIELLNNPDNGGIESRDPSEENNETKPPITQENGYKIENSNFICKPEMTVEQIKKELTDITIQDVSKANKTSGNLATGDTITYKENSYTIIVLGDINGDGKVLASDALAVLKSSTGASPLKDIYLKAADVNNDEKVLAIDALKILKYSTGKENIII